MLPYCPECNATVASEDMLICKSCNSVRPPFGWATDPLLGGQVDNGRYRVDRRLGAGGFGAVYEVTHTLVEQKRAMKVMDKQLVGTPEVQRRFIDEWDILDKLEHPNIVRCFEIGILPETQQPFMLLELLQGRNLFDVIWPRGANAPSRMAPPRAARVGWQIASALAAAHARGLLHRDLKPDNVLLIHSADGREQVKVIDFGIAKILGTATVDRKTSRIVGTPEYMAPEQFNPGQELDGRLDLWQLGAVLFFIITGWPPYTAVDDDPFAVYRAMREREGLGAAPSEQYTPMRDCPGLDRLVASLLSTDPNRRPSDATEVANTITALFEQGELSDGELPPGHNTPFNRNTTGQVARHGDATPLPSNQKPSTPDVAPSARTVAKVRHLKDRLSNGPEEPAPIVQPTAQSTARQVGPRQADERPPVSSQPTARQPAERPRTTARNPTEAARQPTARQGRPKPGERPERAGAGGRRTLIIAVIVAVLAIAATATALLVPWQSLLGGHDGGPKAQFVRVATGRFAMGSPEDEAGRSNNETRHDVTITVPFFIQTTEVTQGQWQRLMGNNPSRFPDCGDDCPIDNVSWWDTLEYLNRMSSSEGLEQCYELSGCIGTPGANFRCEKLEFVGLECSGYRLPTEAEWEYAARAGTGSAFYSGDVDPARADCSPVDDRLAQIAWYCGNASGRPHPVGARKPNFWGVHDALGNVSEWVWDWNFGDYPGDSATDPLGPEKGAGRTWRGGSFMSPARDTRAANRGYEEPEKRRDNLGFRPVRAAL